MEKNKLRELINQVGGEIQDKLEPLPHRRQRNPYAHLYGIIKEVTGSTYSESEPDVVASILEIVRENPNISSTDLRSELDQISK